MSVHQKALLRSTKTSTKEVLNYAAIFDTPYIAAGIGNPITGVKVLTPLGIRTCFKPQTTLKNILTHVKDPVPPEEKTGVVYRVPCSDCQATYVHGSDRENSIPLPQGAQEGLDHSKPHEFCTCRTCHGHWA